MINDDREIFLHISNNDKTSLETDFMTYAVYAFEKYQWVEQCRLRIGAFPTETETNRWISEITDYRLASFREEAARLFDAGARNYLKDELEVEKRRAVDESILNEVKASGSFWRQIGIALITSILAPLIIGAMIVAALAYERVMITATGVSQHLQ
jgi:hypothetical protein